MVRTNLQPSTWLLLCYFGQIVRTAIVTYDFNITWVTANPDRAFNRPTIGINGQWPLPHITATVGDRVVVNVLNQLGNQSTSLHFHGLYMNGSTHMDGTTGVTQCSIPAGASFTYDFKVSPSLLAIKFELKTRRLISLVPIGTIPTIMVSIQMALGGPSSSPTQILLIMASMKKK